MMAAFLLIGLAACQTSRAATRVARNPRDPPRAVDTVYSLEIITPGKKNPPFVPGNTTIKDLNNAGQVVGWSSVGNDSLGSPIFHAFRYEGAKLVDMGAPGAGSQSSASSINDAGRAVGYYITAASDVLGFFTAPNGGVTTANDLPTTIPTAVNNRDEYVGGDQVTGQGVYVSPVTGSHLFTVGDFNALNGISSPGAGQPLRIAGVFAELENPAAGRGVLWTDANGNGVADAGETTVLEPFDALGASTALKVNAAGQVVGQSDHPSGAPHGFLYTAATGQMLDLGTLPATGVFAPDSSATAINETGDIVGYSMNRAVIWQKDGNGVYQIRDLNLAIPGGTGTFVAQRAYGINASGQIAGEGTQDGLTVGFLLTPIPPPPTADLSVTQTVSVSPGKVTQPLTYTITARNNGPSTAASVVVRDTLPAGLPGATVRAVSGTATMTGGVVTWNVGTLTSGQSLTLTIIGTPTAAVTLNNSATISGNVTDGNSANDTSALSTPVANLSADLALTVTPSASSATVGQNLTYTLVATNNGPDSAAGVTVTANVPMGASFVSSTPAVTPSAGTVTFNAGILASGASFTATLVVKPTGIGTLVENASAAGTTADPNTANNAASASTPVQPVTSDLSVTLSAAPNGLKVGQGLSYTVTAANNGPTDATNARVTVSLPAGLASVALQTAAGTAANASGTVTWNIGTLGNGKSVTLTVISTPGTAGKLTTSASITSDVNDSNNANNTATASTTVNPLQADLSVSITAGTATAQVGQNLTYTIRVSNSGPDGATGVVVTANVPDGTSFVSGTPNATVNGTAVTFNVGSVTAGSPVAVTLVVKPNASGAALETATAAGTSVDSVPINNTANLSVPVTSEPPQPLPPSDLTGQWTGAVHPVLHGKGKTSYYTLDASFTVKNIGAGPATPFKVRFLASKNTALDKKDKPVSVVADGHTVLMEISVPGLDAGGSQTFGADQFGSLHLTAKSLAAFKNKYLIAVVDFGNAVAESNENNNTIVSPKVR